MKPSQRTRTARWLVRSGWYESPEGWRHPNLNGGMFPWTMRTAQRLLSETLAGANEPVHLMLAGEC